MPNKSAPRAGAAQPLALDILLRPARALDRITSEDGAFRDSALIYAVYLATGVLFYAFKPQDFPPVADGAPVMRLEGGFSFWLKVHAWNPVFTAVGVAMVAWFARLLQGGKLAFRLVLSLGAAALPMLVLLAYTNNALSKPGFALAWLALLALSSPGFLKIERSSWPALFAVFFAVNAAAVAALPVFCAAILTRSALFYNVAEIAMLFWMLGLAAYGVHRATGLPTARAFCAIFFSTLTQVFFVFSLHMLGLIPKDALKALMTV